MNSYLLAMLSAAVSSSFFRGKKRLSLLDAKNIFEENLEPIRKRAQSVRNIYPPKSAAPTASSTGSPGVSSPVRLVLWYIACG